MPTYLKISFRKPPLQNEGYPPLLSELSPIFKPMIPPQSTTINAFYTRSGCPVLFTIPPHLRRNDSTGELSNSKISTITGDNLQRTKAQSLSRMFVLKPSYSPCIVTVCPVVNRFSSASCFLSKVHRTFHFSCFSALASIT